MKSFSQYDASTGLFTGVTHSSTIDDPDYLARNTPDGRKFLEGVYDHQSKRVDLATGEVVDYQPPAPSPEAQAALVKAAKRKAALQRITYLESKSLRAMREAILDPIGGTHRMQAIHDEIDALRADL